MEILKNIEQKFEKEMTNLEEKPVKTIIKWAIIIYFARKLFAWMQNDK
jgi:hypothetical protein